MSWKEVLKNVNMNIVYVLAVLREEKETLNIANFCNLRRACGGKLTCNDVMQSSVQQYWFSNITLNI